MLGSSANQISDFERLKVEFLRVSSDTYRSFFLD
jgi:hypothetical protein